MTTHMNMTVMYTYHANYITTDGQPSKLAMYTVDKQDCDSLKQHLINNNVNVLDVQYINMQPISHDDLYTLMTSGSSS